MGGTSSQGAAAGETPARLERLRRLCPPGWEVAGFLPIDSAVTYRLQRQQLTAGCSRHDCRRQVELYLGDLVWSEHSEHRISFVVEQLKSGPWHGGLEAAGDLPGRRAADQHGATAVRASGDRLLRARMWAGSHSCRRSITSAGRRWRREHRGECARDRDPRAVSSVSRARF